MVTTVGTESSPMDLLNHLIQLDYDAAESYRAAISRLENRSYADQLRAFLADHERHTENLAPFVTALGGTPATECSAKSLVTTGKVAIADFVGDRAVLQAMRSNEDDTNTAYERAARHHDLSAEARTVIANNLADERRHRAWIEETLAHG